MKRITDGFSGHDRDYKGFEKKLQEIAIKKKGEIISVETVITDVWGIILNGLPYVQQEKTGDYIISQAKDFKQLIYKSKNPCCWNRIRTLLDMDMELKDKSLEAKNGFIRPHNKNVSRYAQIVAKTMGYRQETIDQIAFSGELHDIGKIGIPDYILNKPGKLTQEEFELVKPHPTIGAKILIALSNLFDITLDRTISEVEMHHERYFGGGYPYNKKGEEIPLGAQIITICDVFDAITSHRPYSPPVDPQKAIEEMRRNEFGSFNPELLEHAIMPLKKAYMELQQN